jgi:putative PIN family toxin of toxin-antitoxin system
MKVVLDTNVLVSALLSANGAPARILALALNGGLILAYDNRILFEYSDVLSREEFHFESAVISNLLAYFKVAGEYVNADTARMQFADEADTKFYEVYKSAEARYLITGNLRHFPKEKAILSPAEFLEIFKP